MWLVHTIARQPAADELVACDEQITLWRRRSVEAVPESPWACVCAEVVDKWLDVRSELSAALELQATFRRTRAAAGLCLGRDPLNPPTP